MMPAAHQSEIRNKAVLPFAIKGGLTEDVNRWEVDDGA